MIVVLGAGGMLGEAVVRRLIADGREVAAFTHEQCDASVPLHVRAAMQATLPRVVVNCAGVLPGRDRETMRAVNTEAPRTVALEAAAVGARVIHVSTDCVFSGQQTDLLHTYTPPDAADDYGSTKASGEMVMQHVLNVRTSFIGARHGLVPWYRQQEQPVRGYARWYWSGQTVENVAGAIADRIFTEEHGLVHLATRLPMTKLHVLRLLHVAVRGQEVVPDWAPYRNHALVPTRGWELPPLTMEDIERAI